MTKELLIVGGPNGSGKTTFAKSFLQEYKYEFLNADEIARELSNDGSRAGNISSGKEYFKRIEKLKAKNKNIILESTLSGLFLRKLIREFKKKDYSIKIVFIVLNAPEQCIGRIKHRVETGGHFVPDDDVRRRFTRGKNNFWKIYKDLVEDWKLFNNTESGFEIIAAGEKNKYDIVNQSLFDLFIKDIEK
ncbi:MAG TPA: AAA family ATPase [Bacteroidia bacterium]|nr:AAA family ATPase [Bacteroidia bacterium]QQR95987.1 MAG: AAA family ATPase [Bacteroidota bacterium]MBP7713575.1 AAA family ATPase [Bacteroidia bacterium]MBP8667652.1 AAA family ATPase [Bacteroidia bacterium]HOZ81288.1 AAA family ATPase [Bacteroidia bacterium]